MPEFRVDVEWCSEQERSVLRIIRNGKVVREEYDYGEPEDNSFSRDWSWVKDAILDAYEAGKTDEREACALECDAERMACERHAKALPKAPIHQVGVQIADVCSRRIRARGKGGT